MDYGEVSRIALCSEYHFKRMFSFLTEISLSEYVRRRRLTLAAIDLKDQNVRVIDVAVKYRIVEKGSFRLAGLKKRVPIVFEGVNPEIAEMSKLLTPEVVGKLKSIANVEPAGIISASTNFSEGRMEERGELDHYIGVATLSNDVTEFDFLEIDACT